MRSRPVLPRLVLGVLIGSVGLAFAPTGARAEEPKQDVADGTDECRAFEAKNEKELADWSKLQPSVPYKYARPDTVLGAPWGPFLEGSGKSGELLVATLVPHVGAQLRGDLPAALLALPWSVPFGPAYTCSRKQGSFVVNKYKVHRLLFEPAFFTNNRGVGGYLRPGYRFLYHPSDWVVGVGGGIGSTIEAAKNESLRASLGAEAVMQFGHCCDSGYFTLNFRYDRFFGGSFLDMIGGTLGFVYF